MLFAIHFWNFPPIRVGWSVFQFTNIDQLTHFTAPPVALPSLIVEPINDDASSPSIFPEPEGIHAAPLIDRGINSSASTTMDNFEDLDVPEGVEGLNTSPLQWVLKNQHNFKWYY